MNSGKFAGAFARWAGENRERGEIPRQDRCCDAERRAGCHWIDSEKAARRDEAQSEDLPAKCVSNLRPVAGLDLHAYRDWHKERYVPEARAAAGVPRGRAALAMLNQSRDISARAAVSRVFMSCRGKTCVFPWIGECVAERAGVGWYPTAARCGSRQPTGSAVPDGLRPPRPSPWARASASPGTGV